MEPVAPIHYAHELELASELLEAARPPEVDNAFRRVFAGTRAAVGTTASPQAAAALTAMLRETAQQTLPNLARAPRLAEQAGSLLGLELEGLSPPDQEFEAARQFVRLAANAYARLASAPPHVPPEDAARRALASAAGRYAPGALTQIVGPPVRHHDTKEHR